MCGVKVKGPGGGVRRAPTCAGCLAGLGGCGHGPLRSMLCCGLCQGRPWRRFPQPGERARGQGPWGGATPRSRERGGAGCGGTRGHARGQGHGPPRRRCPASPSGWVAQPQGIPALRGGLSGRGLSERPPPPTHDARSQSGGGLGGKGGRLNEEVLFVLVDVQLEA